MSDHLPAARLEDIGVLIRAKRREERLTLEQVAQQSGVSAATLSRLERQPATGAGDKSLPVPDTRTVAAVARWLGVSLAHVLDAEAGLVPPGGGLPDMVEAHLRADRHLDPVAAAMLARIFRAGYQQALRPSTPSAEEPAPDRPTSQPTAGHATGEPDAPARSA